MTAPDDTLHPARAAAIDPYITLEWDEDDIATVVLKEPGRPQWVRDEYLVRFNWSDGFDFAKNCPFCWTELLAFQIKRQPAPTSAEPQLFVLLSSATDEEAKAIRSAARRAKIEVPE